MADFIIVAAERPVCVIHDAGDERDALSVFQGEEGGVRAVGSDVVFHAAYGRLRAVRALETAPGEFTPA
ncbi:hypothetical protein [Candidatus Solirubrobacter pratensis]|uniref:hypothetical protein n=1 Tax=Candidatus Solirubrobacter pratensis TaxID=1298857 RepID=UPI0003F75A75|nr:hypothetical protein [Candidatus Solirubrobacter pratensis]